MVELDESAEEEEDPELADSLEREDPSELAEPDFGDELELLRESVR